MPVSPLGLVIVLFWNMTVPCAYWINAPISWGSVPLVVIELPRDGVAPPIRLPAALPLRSIPIWAPVIVLPWMVNSGALGVIPRSFVSMPSREFVMMLLVIDVSLLKTIMAAADS